MYVRRVFITDDFTDMMPKYLQFIRGVVDSDDLPLNVSRETLQQHKLLKVIKKKLVRKALDMIKKIDVDEYTETFWKQYSTKYAIFDLTWFYTFLASNSVSSRITLIEPDLPNSSDSELPRTTVKAGTHLKSTSSEWRRTRRRSSSAPELPSRTSRSVITRCLILINLFKDSIFIERLIKKGYEIIYLVEPVDEYTIQALPEFDGKKFQNVAKEGVDIDVNKSYLERMEKKYEPLLDWLKSKALFNKIEKVRKYFKFYP